MRRIATLPRLMLLLAAIGCLLALTSTTLAHSPEGTYSARADLRIDEQRGLRVRTWFEVPESSKVAQVEANAAVAQLGECLELTVGEEPLAGRWVAGDDPKHGLSNGSHRLFALEFEPETAPAGSSLDVTLVVGCFPEKDLAFSATVRARSPWGVESEAMLEKPARHHDHEPGAGLGAGQAEDATDTRGRTARVVFSRQSM